MEACIVSTTSAIKQRYEMEDCIVSTTSAIKQLFKIMYPGQCFQTSIMHYFALTVWMTGFIL